MIPVSINDKSVPKVIRKKAKLIAELWKKNKIDKLRELRESSKNFGIHIYHHSQGTDSYYHDTEGRYYAWAQIEAMDLLRLNNGEHFSTVVIPYKAGIHFIKSSLAPNPILN
ncbi:hypothetical protein ACTHQF_06655 [Pedobacter sp. SAFR-022]|uniref:hypothetical protein n=1 Tax=Pedobacter sp. SAFR-022 TaxID=3436861 RepID=UPI003F7E491B